MSGMAVSSGVPAGKPRHEDLFSSRECEVGSKLLHWVEGNSASLGSCKVSSFLPQSPGRSVFRELFTTLRVLSSLFRGTSLATPAIGNCPEGPLQSPLPHWQQGKQCFLPCSGWRVDKEARLSFDEVGTQGSSTNIPPPLPSYLF